MHVAVNGMLLGPRSAGVEYSILHLAAGLAEGGRERYTLYVPNRSTVELPESDRLRVHRTMGLSSPRFLRIAWEQLVLPRLVASHGADLVHAPGYIAPLAVHRPVVLTVYDTIAVHFPQWSRRANVFHYRLLLPASIRKARLILVPSETTRRDVCRLVPSAEARVRVVPLGVASRFHAPPDPERVADLRARYLLPQRFVLFVGQHEPKKNLPVLLEAFAMLKRQGRTPHRLVLAGRHGWGIAPLRHHVRRLGIESETIVTGVIPRQDLPVLYAAAELFVFPSLYEGFGLPPLEAMASGTPVVSSDRGALAENLSGAALLVSPDDPAGVARAMRAVLESRSLQESLVTQGRRRAAGFSWRRTVRETDRAYRDACEAPP